MREKRYIITKSVNAKNIGDALKKEKTAEVEEIYAAEEQEEKSLGFKHD